MLIRCSSLDDIMGSTRGSQPYGLSLTAQGVIKDLVDSRMYNTSLFIDNKYVRKGIECEDDSIKLFNEVYFKSLVKNYIRLKNEYITGECDLIDGDAVIDIKTSWDLKSFAKQRRTTTSYEWQLRGYMWLYNKDKAYTAHCLVDTPEHIARHEAESHKFGHIPAEDRVIIGNIVYRDEELESKMIKKVEACRKLYNDLVENFNNEGRVLP